MRLIIDIKDTELGKDHKNLLKNNLNLKTEKDLEQALTRLCKSAIFEYLHMFFEDGVPHSADEVKQHRLYLMVLYYYRNRIPCEAEIASIFQLTNSQSKTLLRNTIAGYQSEISDQVKSTLRKVLQNPRQNPKSKKYEMEIKSEVFREELNWIVSQKWADHASISKKRGSAAEYEAEQSTYLKLKDYLK